MFTHLLILQCYAMFFKYRQEINADNILYKGMIASDDLVVRRKKTIVKRMRDYLDYICNCDYLTTSLLPMGDGVAISYKDSKRGENKDA